MADILIEKFSQSFFDRCVVPMSKELTVVYRSLFKEIFKIIDDSVDKKIPEDTLHQIFDLIEGERESANFLVEKATNLDKLKKRVGYFGQSYKNLMSKIIDQNTQDITKIVYNQSNDSFSAGLKRAKVADRFVLPSLEDITQNPTIRIRKSAERGRLLTETLRQELSEDLQGMFDIVTPVTGKQRIIRRTGTMAGTMNPEMIDIFKEKITKTFENYNKTDPKYGVPSNIHQIAVTELRSITNQVKNDYVTNMVQDNPNILVMKKWKQNKNLSKIPRSNHGVASRLAAIPLNENFVFPSVKGGEISIPHPHHSDLPPEEVIGCNCELEYKFIKIDKSILKSMERQVKAVLANK